MTPLLLGFLALGLLDLVECAMPADPARMARLMRETAGIFMLGIGAFFSPGG